MIPYVKPFAYGHGCPDRLRLYVDDLEAAKEFYENLLGLKDPSRMGPEAWFYSLTDTVGLYLEGGESTKRDKQGHDPGIIHFPNSLRILSLYQNEGGGRSVSARQSITPG